MDSLKNECGETHVLQKTSYMRVTCWLNASYITHRLFDSRRLDHNINFVFTFFFSCFLSFCSSLFRVTMNDIKAMVWQKSQTVSQVCFLSDSMKMLLQWVSENTSSVTQWTPLSPGPPSPPQLLSEIASSVTHWTCLLNDLINITSQWLNENTSSVTQ